MKNHGEPVLWIRDVYTGSRIRIFFHPGSASKNLSILTPKILSSRKYDPGCSSRIRILSFQATGGGKITFTTIVVAHPKYCGSGSNFHVDADPYLDKSPKYSSDFMINRNILSWCRSALVSMPIWIQLFTSMRIRIPRSGFAVTKS